MTQTFDLEKMNLAPMNEIEMQEVDGGGEPVSEQLKEIGMAVLVAICCF